MGKFSKKRKLGSQKKIHRLEKEVAHLRTYVQHLEKMNEAYSQLEELSRKERLEAESTIKAQQQVQELMNRERIAADQTIKAQEQVVDLSVIEKQEALETIKAHEKLQELIRKEKVDAEKLLQAHEKIFEMSTLEQMEAQKVIEAQEHLSELTMQELLQKDSTIQNILLINKNISAILDEHDLLEKILSSLTKTLHATRGALFINQEGRLIPRDFLNFSPDALSGENFRYQMEMINNSFQTGESALEINHKLPNNGDTINCSIITCPLIFEEQTLGLIYIDMISDDSNFRSLDLHVAEIFSAQAAIAIHNALMYKKIKEQNRRLLRLENFKNTFINHLSDELSGPVDSLQQSINRIEEEFPAHSETQDKLYRRTGTQLRKIENTVRKVLNSIALEQEVEALFRDPVNLPALLNNVIDRHRAEAERKNLNIKTDFPANLQPYRGNKPMLRTICDELVSNAIFYNVENGSVTVTITLKDEYLYLTVQDTGTGIDQENLENIFRQFFRTEDSAEMNEWGAGLGLYMARSSARQYGGDITVESTPGKGSTFTVTLLLQ